MTDPAVITASSTAEYFAKNLQQVGFSSLVKAVLTTLKEAVDNSLDACEEAGILPHIQVDVRRIGKGSLKGGDRIYLMVEDNGPGLESNQVGMVFGEYLASSKFGRGRCSRGQQGIGISAATTWAVQTSAKGVRVLTKRAGQRKAFQCTVATNLKTNKGVVSEKELVLWDAPHGTRVQFELDGKLQLNGDGGLLAYIRANLLVNPHLHLTYRIGEGPVLDVPRLLERMPLVPPAQPPHLHTLKLGEFIQAAHAAGSKSLGEWLRSHFSRVSVGEVDAAVAASSWTPERAKVAISAFSETELAQLYAAVQQIPLRPPSTSSVMAIGEDALALSIQRLGEVDYFGIVSRKPVICDMKPVQVEVAIARHNSGAEDGPVTVLRFANRVPLQFDKASCAIVKAITSVNWKAYGLRQSRGVLPTGPFTFAMSVVSPFIKFKNASKETIDASDELVEELRRALMLAGQRLARHLRRETKAQELKSKSQHVEKFSPILVESLLKITGESEVRRERALRGIDRLLSVDKASVVQELARAETRLQSHLELQRAKLEHYERHGGEESSSEENE